MNELFFDKAAGIKVQKEQLAKWKPRLAPECYAALEARCKLENDKNDDDSGYGVFRGGDMNSVINNWTAEEKAPLVEVDEAKEALKKILDANRTKPNLKFGRIIEHGFLQGWIAAKGHELPFFTVCMLSGRSILD